MIWREKRQEIGFNLLICSVVFEKFEEQYRDAENCLE
jgi:hypothetical protein